MITVLSQKSCTKRRFLLSAEQCAILVTICVFILAEILYYVWLLLFRDQAFKRGVAIEGTPINCWPNRVNYITTFLTPLKKAGGCRAHVHCPRRHLSADNVCHTDYDHLTINYQRHMSAFYVCHTDYDHLTKMYQRHMSSDYVCLCHTDYDHLITSLSMSRVCLYKINSRLNDTHAHGI